MNMKFLPALILLLLAAGCVRKSTDAPTGIAQSEDAESEWVDSVMSCMTLEERVGQLFMPSVNTECGALDVRRLKGYVADCHIGGLLLLSGDTLSARQLSDTLRKVSAVVPWVAIDAEWGLGMRLKDAPSYPMNSELDAHDTLMLRKYGSEVGRLAKSLGINMVLGPVADVAAGSGSVMYRRSFGGDASVVADAVVSYMRGLESEGVMSMAKHFPGEGSLTEDTHDRLTVIDRSLAELEAVDLVPFRRYVQAGGSGVMVGHAVVSAIDPDGRAGAFSSAVISDLLRNDIGFQGLVATDAINMKGSGAGDEGAVDALMAGADLIISPSDTRKAVDAVIQAVRSGRLPLSRIDDACRRVLRYKYRFAR